MYPYFVPLATAAAIILCLSTLFEDRLPSGCRNFLNKTSEKTAALTRRFGGFAERHSGVVLFLLFLLFLFTRLYKLGLVPNQVHQDEMGMAYDARCLLQYHKDRYGHFFPVYLTNFGSGQSALYAYLTALLLRFFDFSITVVRLPAVLSAIPCFFCSYLIAKELFQSKKAALLAPVLVTILPVYFLSERWALDCYLFLSYLTVGFYFYIKALASKRGRDYFLAGLFLGVSLYSYAVSYMVVPLFLVFSTLYSVRTGKFEWKKVAVMAVPLVILGLPLLLFQLVNMDLFPEIQTRYISIYKLLRYRRGEITPANIPANLRFLPGLVTYDQLLPYNATYEYGAIYTFSIPFLFYGAGIAFRAAYQSVKSRTYSPRAVVLLMFLANFIAVMVIRTPYVHRANGLYLPMMLLIAIAVEHICHHIKCFGPVISLLYTVTFLSFSIFYFRDYNTVYHNVLNFQDANLGEMVEYLNREYDVDGRLVYIHARDVGYPELQALLYGNVPPDGWDDGEPLQGNYYFGLPETPDPHEDCLYIIHDELRGVADKLEREGFSKDRSFQDYSILYRPPLK